MDSLWIWAFSLNAILIVFAQRLPLLTPSGWFHAGVLGTILWGCLGWRGWLSVVIYLALGSFVTRIGFARKQSSGLAEARGGKRGPENVWGSAATGAILALLIKAGFVPEGLFLIGFAASFAAKLADTFGSEIGKRWGRRTVLITSLRAVPAGTDGAISIEGTIASILGSFLMTAVAVSLSIIPSGAIAFLVFCVGLFSTLLESFLGALAQNRFRWLSNEFVNFLQTSWASIIAISFAYSLF